MLPCPHRCASGRIASDDSPWRSWVGGGAGVCSSVAERIRPLDHASPLSVFDRRASRLLVVAAICGAVRPSPARSPPPEPAGAGPDPVTCAPRVGHGRRRQRAVDLLGRAVGGVRRPCRRSRVRVPHRPPDEHHGRDVARPGRRARRQHDPSPPVGRRMRDRRRHRDRIRPVPRRRPRRPLGRLPAGRARMRRPAQRAGSSCPARSSRASPATTCSPTRRRRSTARARRSPTSTRPTTPPKAWRRSASSTSPCRSTRRAASRSSPGCRRRRRAVRSSTAAPAIR